MSETNGAIERLYRRVLMTIGRGRIKTGKDDGAVQLQQVRLGVFETFDDLPRLAEYGFNSMPPAESDAVLLFVGGNRSDGVIIATGNQTFRVRNLKPGEVSISDNLGQSVFLSQAGIVVDGGGLPVVVQNTPSIKLDSAKVHMTGDLDVDGSIVAQGDISDHGEKSMAGMRDVYNGHSHPVAGVKGGSDRVNSQSPGAQQ